MRTFFSCSVLYNIMANDFVGETYKARLRKSAKVGRDGAKDVGVNPNGKTSCLAEFPCLQLDSRSNNMVPATERLGTILSKQNLQRN